MVRVASVRYGKSEVLEAHHLRRDASWYLVEAGWGKKGRPKGPSSEVLRYQPNFGLVRRPSSNGHGMRWKDAWGTRVLWRLPDIVLGGTTCHRSINRGPISSKDRSTQPFSRDACIDPRGTAGKLLNPASEQL